MKREALVLPEHILYRRMVCIMKTIIQRFMTYT